MVELADAMYESRTLGVRLVDDGLLDAAASGRTQIVLLGAGLDTHAFRLRWPTPVRLFEIDLPPLLEFKEPVLESGRAESTCERHVIPAEIADGTWAQALLDDGFDTETPTHWVDHAIMTLPTARARDAVAAITELSAPTSRYGFPVMTGDSFARYRRR